MSFFSISPAAIGLLMLMLFGSGFVGLVGGSWIVPTGLALYHGGIDDVCFISVEEGVFAALPSWVEESSFSGLAKFAQVLTTLVIVGLFLKSVQRKWESLVVYKWAWVTEEQMKNWRKRTDMW